MTSTSLDYLAASFELHLRAEGKSAKTVPKRTLTELELVVEHLTDWRMLIDRLHASIDTGDFASAVTLVDAIAVAAEERAHHPHLDLSYGRLDVRLISQDVSGVTSRDVQLARRISELARAVGATPQPARTSVLELGLDTADEAEIRPFWAALLAYDTVDAWERSSSATPPGAERRSGSSPPTPPTFRANAGTSTCAFHPRLSRTASQQQSAQAVNWSTTPLRRRTGCWPTRRATARA